MLISFFEEFPDNDTLAKIKLISFPSKLYLAAKSFSEFKLIKSGIENENIVEIVYWPILSKKEGYWISPFSKRSALERVFSELVSHDQNVMLDLELPLRHNPFLILTQGPYFFRNKRLISNFVKRHKGKTYFAEYYPAARTSQRILQGLGLHYPSDAGIIKMFYHSLHTFHEKSFTKHLRDDKKSFGDNFIPAFGTIATGIHGTEPILSYEQLEKDLSIASEEGIKEVILFRLGGLNDEFLKVIGKFSD